jgi:serine/threonine protein kinase
LTDAILHAVPQPPGRIHADLSRRLEDVIVKCLEKDPDSRYQSGRDPLLSTRTRWPRWCSRLAWWSGILTPPNSAVSSRR